MIKNNPFGELRRQLGLPEVPEVNGTPEPRDSGTPEPLDVGTSGPRRAVVRYERAGRGGKEVTVVEQLGLKEPDLQRWLKEMKAALGCGGSVDGDAVMLQGDHRKRLPAILAARGVKKVTVG